MFNVVKGLVPAKKQPQRLQLQNNDLFSVFKLSVLSLVF
jgi:hypothetical protein